MSVSPESRSSDEPAFDECRRAFSGVTYLDALGDDDVEALRPLMHSVAFTAGDSLFFEGDSGSSVYFLLEGDVEIFKSDDLGEKLPLVVLNGVGVLGEMGLVCNSPRSATALALTDVRALVIPDTAFETALRNGNLAAFRMVLALARVLSQRLAAMDTKLFTLFVSDASGARFRDLDDLRHRLLTSWIV